MSFIFQDPNLIDQLLESGASFELKFSKKGQAAAAASQDDANLLNLLKGLKEQLTTPPKEDQIAWGGSPPDLKSSNMDSLGDFVQWLSAHGGKIDGKNIVLPGKMEKPAEGYSAVKIDPSTKIVTPLMPTDPSTTERFWVNTDGLQQYLTSLLATTKQMSDKGKPNVLFSMQLSKLIQDANQHLFPTPMSEQHQAAPIPDKTLVDSLSNPLNPSSPMNKGNVALYYGDLKDQASFNDFCKSSDIGWQDKALTMNNAPDKFDRCAVLNLLFYRATTLDNAAGNQKMPNTNLTEKQLYSAYLGAVKKLSGQMNCRLTGTLGQTGGSAPITNQQDGGSLSQTQLIENTLQTLPLSLQNIDFGRIREFFQLMNQLTRGTAIYSTVSGYIQKTEDLMQQASNMTANKDTVFQTGITPTAVINMFADKQTPGKHFYPFVQLLDQIVDNVRALVGYLYSQYGTQIEGTNPNGIDLILGQIGRTPNDSSIYSRNIRYLQQLQNTQHT